MVMGLIHAAAQLYQGRAVLGTSDESHQTSIDYSPAATIAAIHAWLDQGSAICRFP
jgi:hypothetical protein